MLQAIQSQGVRKLNDVKAVTNGTLGAIKNDRSTIESVLEDIKVFDG
jgi:hypothetical protein